MGRKSQAKGRAGELELARILQGYGYPVEPGQAVSYGATMAFRLYSGERTAVRGWW